MMREKSQILIFSSIMRHSQEISMKSEMLSLNVKTFLLRSIK
jgi:hypothetical protein